MALYFKYLRIMLQATLKIFLPAQGSSSLGVVFVVIQAQQQLSQVGVYLMIANARENLEEK